MKTNLLAGAAMAAMLIAGGADADDPNPDVAKAIQEIAARRAEKDDAKVKQVEAHLKNDGHEGGPQAGAKPDDKANKK